MAEGGRGRRLRRRHDRALVDLRRSLGHGDPAWRLPRRFQSAWFGLGVLALLATGWKKFGVILTVLTIANLILVYHWHQQKG